MTPDVVVDVGNSLIKWGVCRPGAVTRALTLPPDDPAAWDDALDGAAPGAWAVAGVHPARRDRFVAWLQDRGARFWVLESYRQLPIDVPLPEPGRVGIDRLLNAVAARAEVPDGSAIAVDVGTAVTVDLVHAGAFRGGAILPGPRLMAKSLHEYTAALPLVMPIPEHPEVPGTATGPAIELGVHSALCGGVARSSCRLEESVGAGAGSLPVYLTGGGSGLLVPSFPAAHHRPFLTLEGLRIAAEAQP